jgi:uncharacterized protein (TIGR00661 family)
MGIGHASQQWNWIAQLQRRGHQVGVVTFGDGAAALRDAFPAPVPITVPTHFPGGWLAVGAQGVDISASAANGRSQDPRGDAWNFALCEQVVEQLGGEPDVVFTDYEPASAQIAYMLGSRLITTEQQSKFLLYRTPDVNGFSRLEEAARLRYFFPAADERIASSFFPMDWERDEKYTGDVLEPILRPDVLDLSPESDDSSVVVYMSPYGPMRQSPEDALKVLAAFPEVRFKVFAKTLPAAAPANVELSVFDRAAFTKALATCSAVISTAGHQLLSECVYLGKPVLGVPFDNYEQSFNAMMIENLGIGMRTRDLDEELVREFLGRREEFADATAKLAVRQFDGGSAGLIERLGL